MLTVEPEVADRFDFIGQHFDLTQEQVVKAAVAMLSGMIESRDPRALRFLQSIRDESHRSLDVALTAQHRGG
jgi:excinuclease UvrABC nuclease subunit